MELAYLWEAGLGQVIKNGDVLAGEMVPLVKCLLCKLEDLRMIPRIHVVLVTVPSAEESELGGSLECLG